MANYNYDDVNDETVDIPDFVEDKDNGDSSSVDMSIFKMSDEELYDDVPKRETRRQDRAPRKKSNATIILCVILIGILLVTSVVSLIYAVKEHGKVTTLNTEITQLKAKNDELNTTVTALSSQIEALNKQIEEAKKGDTQADPNNKYPSGTVLYITQDGGSQGVRVKASKDADTATNSDGSLIVLYWGDKVTLTEDATVDSNGTYWGKTNNGYIRIEVDGEIWATTEEQ